MNQNPEQLATDEIDRQLIACGWVIQNKKVFNQAAGVSVAIRECQTNVGPTDYILLVNQKPVGLIEAKREEHGVRLTRHEEQSTEYAFAKLKYINNDPLPFVYERTGELTRFTNYRNPEPRSRLVFSFYCPQLRNERIDFFSYQPTCYYETSVARHPCIEEIASAKNNQHLKSFGIIV